MPFKPGQSGNPSGRKPGNTSAAEMRRIIQERADDVLQAVIDAAVGGDMQAARMLLDRVCPPLKAREEPLQVPAGGTLADQVAAIGALMASGDIDVATGLRLIETLNTAAKTIADIQYRSKMSILDF